MDGRRIHLGVDLAAAVAGVPPPARVPVTYPVVVAVGVGVGVSLIASLRVAGAT